MRLIESTVEYIPQGEGLEGIYKQIELCGRTCYKSEDKITEDSAKGFVNRMIKSGHLSMTEHGTIYLKVDMQDTLAYSIWNRYMENPYSKSSQIQLNPKDPHKGFVCVTTNYRVLLENCWLNDLQYICEPTEFHERRYTLKFITDRGVSHELVRHRKFSFAQESQRYCNYSKEKHGNDITFIKPSLLNCTYKHIPLESELCYLAKQHPDEAAHRFIASLVESKYAYMTLLQKGCSPQEARAVLPNATKTEIVMTGFASDWRFLLDLRLFEKTGKVHPDMLNLMQKTQKTMQEAGIWDDIMSKPSKFE